MTFTKTEIRWLFTVIVFYVLYNLPFVPFYESPVGTLVHALLTLIPLWISVYIGLIKVTRTYDSLDKKKEKETKTSKEKDVTTP